MRILILTLSTCLLVACGGGGGGSDRSPNPINNPPPPDPGPTATELTEASKLLARTTFGPSYDDIYNAADAGLEDWLDQQFVLPVSRHEPIVRRYLNEYGFDPAAIPPPGTFRRFAFYEQALTAPDQLRQLVAYALTQIFVVSDNVDMNRHQSARVFPVITTRCSTHAFGNYRDLLEGGDPAPGDGPLPLVM